MEKNSSDHGSSHSWWLDNHNRPHQSLWLQSTLSEFSTEIKTMLTLIEDDGDAFAKRAEMFYQKRPELIRLLEDLHRSFCALADKYDQLKSESIRASNLGSSSNSSSQFQNCPRGNQEITLLEAPEDQLSHSHPDSDDHSDNSGLVVDFSPVDLSEKLEKEGGNTNNYDSYIRTVARLETEQMCNDMWVNASKPIEDKWQRQADQIVTKVHETVKGLCARIDKLENENSALKNSCGRSKVEIKRTRSRISRMKEAILKKLLR